MKIRNKRFLQSNNHAIQSMNVRQEDKSHQQLNYYARNSPKLKRFLCHNVSPLTTSPSSHRNSTKSFHLSSVRPVSMGSYTPQEQDYVLNSSKNQILIEEEDSAQILIYDEQSDDKQMEESHVSSLKDKQVAQSSLGSVFYSDIKEEEWIGLALSKKNNGGSNIKIEDEQSVEEQIIFNQIIVKEDENEDFNVKKGEEQGLVRQFTFAHQLSQQNASDYSSIQSNKELTISEGRSSNQGMKTPVSEFHQLHSSENEQQEEGIGTQHKVSKQLQNQPIISNPKSMMLLIIEEDNESEKIQQYQSPKFSTFSNMQPIWEKPRKNVSPQIKIQEQQEQLTQEINAQDYQKKTLLRQSKPISAFSRPFGSSIFKLNQILMSVPKGFSPIYHEVHRKLIVDQINVEERLQNQQKTMQNLKALLVLKKEQIQCEQYLVLKDPDPFSQQIMINKLLIKTMVRQLAIKRLG